MWTLGCFTSYNVIRERHRRDLVPFFRVFYWLYAEEDSERREIRTAYPLKYSVK